MSKILVVDDEPDIVHLFKWMLEKEGHSIIEAYSGEECLKKAKEEKPDLILLDVMMPDIQGWEVSKKLKEDSETRDIPIIIVTVKSDENSVKESFRYACANAHISKPIIKEQLLGTVKWVLKTSQRRGE